MFSALVAAGILQFDNNDKNEGLILESLAPQGKGLSTRQANGTKPLRRGPSAALKAFSAALRPFVTLESDLGGNKLAFFAGSPMQRGLPSGLKGNDYINEAVFEVADPIQSSDSAVFSSDGASYFEWLRSYVSYVSDPILPKDDKNEKGNAAMIEYQAAKLAAEQEYQKAFTAFEKAHQLDSTLHFLDWMNGSFGKDYLLAVENRERKSAALQNIQSEEMSDVGLLRQMLDSAKSRLVRKLGSNMSCALDEIDSSGPADTIFRPFYSIPGYSSSSRRWVEEYPVSSRNPRKVVINVGNMQTISWSDLGFPNFINPELSAEATKWLKKVTITLSCTSISSFDVNRGLWDVNGLPKLLPPLMETAPEKLKNPIFKTTKILVAYAVDLVIKIPKEEVDSVNDHGAGCYILPEIGNSWPAMFDQDGELHARLDPDNSRPTLLGVLAREINSV